MLEGAVALAEDEEHRDADGRVSPTLADVESAAQQRVLAYDRAGDGHYDTVSAFIKSLRGNDPDAALYWLAAMITAGEDPRFIVAAADHRASEDIGNADPRALQVAVAAAQALDHVGLPEAQYALAQATIYLATAPKSNRSGPPTGAAMADVTSRGSLPVPNHLRTAGDRRMKAHGIGVGYLYPHEFEGSDVAQQYLPDELADRRYYDPSEEGSERRIGELMDERQAATSRRQAEARPTAPRQRHERHRRRDEERHRVPQEACGHAEEGRRLTMPRVRRPGPLPA